MELITPSKKYLKQYIEACKAYEQTDIECCFQNSTNPNILQTFIDNQDQSKLPAEYVTRTTYWLVDDDKFLGQIDIRHRLTPALEKYGGHIGYAIAFGIFNKGLGTKMLELALPKAKELGLNKVLITCDDDNIGSARVIEKNGGILQDKIKNIRDEKEITTRRYWIEIK